MMLHWLFLELSSGDGTTMSEPFVFELWRVHHKAYNIDVCILLANLQLCCI